jgi:membrane-associated phospholipid phosphatase
MKKHFTFLAVIMIMAVQLQAQIEPSAGKWKTWFISSGKTYRLPPPTSYKAELAQVLSRQKNLDSASLQQILYWNAGAPGYRWQEMMAKLWMSDTSTRGPLANMLLSTAIYDATIAAWDTKYAYSRARPFTADNRIKSLVPKPESPSYPCEHSVAAGVAVSIISHFYPVLADSVKRMAVQMMASRINAGVAYPTDTRAGFELGKRIAEVEILYTKDFAPMVPWDQKMPEGPGLWKGKPMFVTAGLSKTVVLDSSSQFRPGPPPDFTKDMAELKAFKSTFRSNSNAFYYASQPFAEEPVHRKIFENNLHLNPPRAARIYAAQAVATYDAFVACWDAKYAYWATRPDQYDTTYKSLLPTPPFPGYPSGHAVMGGMYGELFSYFFPADRAYFMKRAKDGAESRFHGGIHFRSDNDTGLELGRKVGAAILKKIQTDGADNEQLTKKETKTAQKAIKTTSF